MIDYLTFEARVQPMPWGDAVYTIVPLPADILDALGPTRRVEGEFNDHPVNLAISKAPAEIIDTPFLWAGKSLLDRTGLEPGEVFEARLRPAPDDAVDVPRDVLNALRSADLSEAWEALTPGKKRSALYPVETAKRPETRMKRISKLLDNLR
ncbi:YdeI/OmpD-associated family protein [Hasllibacter sp. MH4015]|uniref:YdeI/OmpD-associated family protein n=1 Tax=Hasllibacter sp. MH4015 TaxID=2854029 RepID=UPI001CD4FB1E|nr:YdeI/OmpD-associated family protein [Hasllibacter sp. MH4015]